MTQSASTIPVLGFSAYSGTGKTTLLEQIIPRLKQHGIRCALIKHAHHDVDVDTPGKDTFRLRQAGANPVLIATRQRWALMVETDDANEEPQLAKIVQQLNPELFDLILVEGFKHEAIAKIELHRSALENPWLYPNDPEIIAIAHDADFSENHPLTQLDLNNPDAIADFIRQWIKPREHHE